MILLFQNKFVKTHLHHSLCIRNGEGSNRGFYEGFFKTLYHLNQIKTITAKINEIKEEIPLFANIHAFFWECRSILELVAQEIYDKKGDKSEQPKFFGAYEKHLKGKVQYTDEKIAEKKEDEENSLLFYLNEYRNAISHRETPGKLISVFLPEGITK